LLSFILIKEEFEDVVVAWNFHSLVNTIVGSAQLIVGANAVGQKKMTQGHEKNLVQVVKSVAPVQNTDFSFLIPPQ
jgi:hypothetical protein